MTTTAPVDGTRTAHFTGHHEAHHAHPVGTETKPSWKTTELFVYLAAVAGVLIASQTVGDGAANNGADYFAADKAWFYITLLTIGYLVSRGLAKAGSRSHALDPRER
ncbi:hypothetical protein [Actinoplanes utahensis]|uniref:Uncharacterized protein n=1 Tax=Actinoplanes utahensis TaxID=1869 RepID=A0A0A6UDY8_ACTUT|nr:hypothetical protein [Actinoplanes utahensis]KHD74245.1 hypothetical protein MB27_29915 [Actinoplanes utahensis]GIF35474.1 hypothetical protein Aut01nite_84600 [Actinoplanes utahensis]